MSRTITVVETWDGPHIGCTVTRMQECVRNENGAISFHWVPTSTHTAHASDRPALYKWIRVYAAAHRAIVGEVTR